MKNCASCKHWHQANTNPSEPRLVGQCRALPPTQNYSWPRTRAEDYCSAWNQGDSFDAGAGSPAQENTLPLFPRAAEHGASQASGKPRRQAKQGRPAPAS